MCTPSRLHKGFFEALTWTPDKNKFESYNELYYLKKPVAYNITSNMKTTTIKNKSFTS